MQVPTLFAMLQAWQAPVQATLQHTLSSQFPDVQSVSVVQLAPGPNLSPHRPLNRLHVTPTQSAFGAQDVAHWMRGPVHLL